ncbi:MAG: hypothetical protein HUN05_19665 [Desulfobacter sp.]|nr:MAG: hypothetical protein HUN05_19665 [Desulfobacter sp.]
MSQSHKLANIARQELKRQDQRKKILFSDSEKALDLILDAPSPATLIQSFPDQDLYYLMHKIGVHDFTPVLAMANSDQWEYILDMEVWDDDRLDPVMMTQVFALLYKADPQRLLRWTITKKPDYIEFFLFHNISIFVREHDELPPSDFDDYITLDDKFYFRFPGRQTQQDGQEDPLTGDHPLDEEAPELIENMLKALAEMDLSVFHGLLLETPALLPAETEEEQFRLKNLRLAEKGFLPFHEAVGIYQPTPRIRHRPKMAGQGQSLDRDIPHPPLFFTQFIQGDNLFVRALGLAEKEALMLDNEIAALINKVITADRVKIQHKDAVKKTINKTMAFLSLGLEVLLKHPPKTEDAARLINTCFLEDIFRTGSKARIQIRTRAKAWYERSFINKNNLPLNFLDESYLGVIGGLLIQRPMFFANYADKELYRDFSSLKDIRSTERILSQIISLDTFLRGLDLDMNSFTQGVLTYKSLILTLWLRNRTELDKKGEFSLAPVPMETFSAFFQDLFKGKTTIDETRSRDLAIWAAQSSNISEKDLDPSLQVVLYSLIQEVEEEYGHVPLSELDPKFIPLFLLTQDQGIIK